MSPQRRDADGRRQTAHSWESLSGSAWPGSSTTRPGDRPGHTEAPTTRQHRPLLDPAEQAGRLERAFGEG